mmetsp:Transcript_41291/g.93384  ORF Transcript_41291/g.93384 Transcript_41291/m.93384 type:complete len:218 (+) Transcript_41291:2599-3252(+)
MAPNAKTWTLPRLWHEVRVPVEHEITVGPGLPPPAIHPTPSHQHRRAPDQKHEGHRIRVARHLLAERVRHRQPGPRSVEVPTATQPPVQRRQHALNLRPMVGRRRGEPRRPHHRRYVPAPVGHEARLERGQSQRVLQPHRALQQDHPSAALLHDRLHEHAEVRGQGGHTHAQHGDGQPRRGRQAPCGGRTPRGHGHGVLFLRAEHTAARPRRQRNWR